MNSIALSFLASSLGVLVLSGCGATRSLKPLGEGNSQIDFSIGGPMINFGIPVPVPYSVIGMSYGVHPKVNLHAAYHPTASVYKVFAMDAGAGGEILDGEGWIPEIYADIDGIYGTDITSNVLLASLSLIVSWQWNDLFPYIGVDNLFQFHDNDRPYSPQVIAPLFGLRGRLGTNWRLGGEFKWAALNHNFKYDNVKHPRAFGTDFGAYAPYIYVGYEF